METAIWFIPSNSSHLAKNRLLLEALRQRGCHIRLLCLDEVLLRKLWTKSQMERSGFSFEILPANGFRAGAHWIRQGLQRQRVVSSLLEFFGRQRADLVIVGAEQCTVSHALGHVARMLGMPSVLVVDGLVAPPNPHFRLGMWRSVYNACARLLRRALQAGTDRASSKADLVLVMNELAKRELMRQGMDEARLRVVGSPEYDALAAEMRLPRPASVVEEIRDRLRIARERPVVMFAHQDLGDANPCGFVAQSVGRMISAARHCGGTVLVKLHPRSVTRIEEWSKWAAEHGFSRDDVVFVLNECTSIEAVWVCSVCATFFSTVAIEAMVCRKPVVFMGYHGCPEALSARDLHGAAIDVLTPRELEQQIVRILSDAQFRDRLVSAAADMFEREMFGLDGRSVDRSADAILGLARTRADKRFTEESSHVAH